MKRKRKNGLETSKGSRVKRRGRVAASILTVAAVATALSGVANSVVWGQTGTATEKGGAGSLLDSTQGNGRFSGARYDGALKPTAKPEESRFSDGAVRGSAGNVVGVDASRAGGRFAGASEFRSKQNFELFYWRNEISRTKEALKQAERALGGGLGKKGGPRLTTAKEPKPVPLAQWRRGVRYGRTPEEVEAARQAELAAALNAGGANGSAADGYVAPVPVDEGFDPATIWMRGRAPILDWSPTPFDLRAENGVAGANGGNWVEVDGRLRSELAGASLAPSGAPVAPISELLAPARSPEENRRAYQEYLTNRLLQTPEVNPLSPISVEFRNGVATIRGVVPTPKAREAAGRVLLAEPDVRSVDNQLAYVRPDGDGPGAIVPVAPVPGTSPAVPTAPVPGTSPAVPGAIPAVPAAPVPGTSPAVPTAPIPGASPAVPTAPIPVPASSAPGTIPILPDLGGATPETRF